MPDSADARPSRLPRAIEALIIALLLASFVTGVAFWWGAARLQELDPPVWLAACRVIHGCLNPCLGVVFGFLLGGHIRHGWQLKANRPSGFILEMSMLVLLLSGLGLYYFGNEGPRQAAVWIHRIVGGALPVMLFAHWFAARRWVKKISR